MLIANVQSAEPIYVIRRQELVEDSEEVEITIFSWDKNGKRVESVAVNWHGSLPAEEVIDLILFLARKIKAPVTRLQRSRGFFAAIVDPGT